MIKKRFISMLVLLAAVVTGAVAQTEELLTTITMSGNGIIAYSVSGRATLSTSGLVETGTVAPDAYGWKNSSSLEIGSVTITAAEGCEITKVVFWNYDFMVGYNGDITDTASPFTCYLKGSMRSLNEDMSSGSSGNIGKIEVYGYAPTVAVTGVTLAPTSATLTLGETETVTLIPTVLPGDATDKSVTWSSSNEAVATVADGVVTAVAAGEATITVTTTDGAFTATCAVTVAAPAASTYTVTLKEGTDDATSWTIAPAEATTTGVAAGTEVKATYGGVKKVKSVKAKKKAAASLIVNPAVGQVIGDDGKNYANAAAATSAGATAVAMIAYVGSETGEAAPYNHGLAIALADEGSLNWSTAKSTCEGKTAITGAKWCLPSQDQWKQMFKANGGNEGSYAGLNATITTAGGYALPWEPAADYWSSSERNPGVYAYLVSLDEGAAYLEGYGSESSGNVKQVRACLAF